MNIIERIRAEIERRMETCDATSKTPNQLLWAELSALLPFLDTLEEPDKDLPLPEDTLIYQKGVKEGRRLEWEDILKDAVEGEVIKTDKHTSIRYKSFYGTDRYFYGIADKQFKPGDKVRIIILPKEDGQ